MKHPCEMPNGNFMHYFAAEKICDIEDCAADVHSLQCKRDGCNYWLILRADGTVDIIERTSE